MLERGDRDRIDDRDVILNACLNDLRWDRQCENGRALYLFDVLHATGEPEWYGAQLQSALADEATECALGQVLELAALLTRGGIDWLRPTIYAAFAHWVAQGRDIGADTLVALDGFDGYALVARAFTAHPRPEEDRWLDHSILNDLIEKFGETTARILTAQLIVSEPATAVYLQQSWREWEDWKRDLAGNSRVSKRRRVDYATIISDIDLPSQSVRFVRNRIDDETLLRLATDVNAETDPARLKKLLRHFYKRTFPLEPDRLIALARGDTKDQMTGKAIVALENVTHPAVFALAREFLEMPGEEWRGAGMLLRNPAPDDLTRFESLLARPDTLAEWEYHRIGLDVLRYFEAQPTREATGSLTLLYENGPCSMCRGHAFDLLDNRGALPEWMRREFAYDSGRHWT